MSILFKYTVFNVLAAPVLIPLNTVMTSLQMSVLGHRNLYGSPSNPNSTELVRKRSQMTAIDKRSIELMAKVTRTPRN